MKTLDNFESGIPPAFLYTDDDLLAKLLLRWGELTLTEKKAVLKVADQSRSVVG